MHLEKQDIFIRCLFHILTGKICKANTFPSCHFSTLCYCRKKYQNNVGKCVLLRPLLDALLCLCGIKLFIISNYFHLKIIKFEIIAIKPSEDLIIWLSRTSDGNCVKAPPVTTTIKQQIGKYHWDDWLLWMSSPILTPPDFNDVFTVHSCAFSQSNLF